MFGAVEGVVTNGPLLRPSLGGFYPGYTFKGSAGEKLQLEMALKLTVRDEVDYLEVIQNGKVFYSARLWRSTKKREDICRRWSSAKAGGR